MGPCGAGKVKTRVYGPMRCGKSKDTGLWARAVREKSRHRFMGPCGARKVKTRVYGPVGCVKGKDTGLWARGMREG
ncbi:hypothetical protein CRG98_046516 [Punica granatum]|uniref:Uncharacterized protein n=1 Tax=Punica granatum TaxID=22663 RepID=A0A2I0HNE9_PUNGR|nr:hypothetical protein CRG98_046516 [Punica granatum]